MLPAPLVLLCQNQEVAEPHPGPAASKVAQGPCPSRGRETPRQWHGRGEERGLVNNPLPSPIPLL